jgi:hypothetical protein
VRQPRVSAFCNHVAPLETAIARASSMKIVRGAENLPGF